MDDEIKEILRNCEKVINEASGYNDTTDKIIDCIINLKKENEKLNNIINEIFEWMQNKYDNSNFTGFTVSFQELQDLKELKEGK